MQKTTEQKSLAFSLVDDIYRDLEFNTLLIGRITIVDIVKYLDRLVTESYYPVYGEPPVIEYANDQIRSLDVCAPLLKMFIQHKCGRGTEFLSSARTICDELGNLYISKSESTVLANDSQFIKICLTMVCFLAMSSVESSTLLAQEIIEINRVLSEAHSLNDPYLIMRMFGDNALFVDEPWKFVNFYLRRMIRIAKELDKKIGGIHCDCVTTVIMNLVGVTYEYIQRNYPKETKPLERTSRKDVIVEA